MSSDFDTGAPPAAPPLSTLALVACIVAMVLAVIGLVGGVLALITSLTGGAFAALAALNNLEDMNSLWMVAAMVIGAVIIASGLLFSLFAGIGGLMGILKRSLGALKWAAIALVVFDVLCHLIWPVIAFAVNAGIMFSTMGPDATALVVVGLPGTILVWVWSLVLTVVWAAIAVIAMRYKPEEATLV